MTDEQLMPKRFLTVMEVAGLLRCGRSRAASLVRQGIIPSVTIGRRRLIPVEWFDRWCADRMREGNAGWEYREPGKAS